MNKQKFIFLAFLLLIFIGVYLYFMSGKPKEKKEQNTMISVTSPQFINNKSIPKKYTCDGINVNPPLVIDNIPAGTKSLALIVDDPDAPGGTWSHWLVWNIDPKTKEIQENEVPSGVIVGKNDFGDMKYDGPCPPSGTHHYFFRLYALDVKLNLPSGSERKILENSMEGHIIDKTELMGKYSR